jgi:hypothetical protein
LQNLAVYSSDCLHDPLSQLAWSVSPSCDILPFGVTIPASVTQRSEIPEGLMIYPILDLTDGW